MQSTERNSTMKATLDKGQFGPWALVTGASSGIGKEFARQIAADFKVDYRALAMDLSQEGFLERLTKDTKDLDIGLVVSNAGTPNPGEFLKLDRQLLQKTLRLNTMSHLDIAHYFGRKLAQR